MAKRRRSRKSSRRSRKSSCSVTAIRFKTRRGVVSFRGRRGGMTTAGGKCSPKTRRTGHLARWKKAMRSAARSCKGRGRGAFRKCVGAKLRAA